MMRRGVYLIVVMTFAGLVGCEPEIRVIRPSFADLRQYADPKNDSPRPRNSRGLANRREWSVPLNQFTGPGRINEAQQLIDQLRSRSTLAELWIEETNDIATVHCGRFDTENNPQAQRVLKLVQRVELNGSKPFVKASLRPLPLNHRVVYDPFDLRQYVGFFSLQVAVFTKEHESDRKAAAEKLTAELREKKEEAYFYHGPHRSSVCIGLFTWDDFVRVGNTDAYGPRIKEIQQRYPYNVINNKTPNPKTDPPKSIQTSSIVRIL